MENMENMEETDAVETTEEVPTTEKQPTDLVVGETVAPIGNDVSVRILIYNVASAIMALLLMYNIVTSQEMADKWLELIAQAIPLCATIIAAYNASKQKKNSTTVVVK